MRNFCALMMAGKFYFIEVAARVGGAYISDVVEAATGVNLWREWARIEVGGGKRPLRIAEIRREYAGVILSLGPAGTAGHFCLYRSGNCHCAWEISSRRICSEIAESRSRQRNCSIPTCCDSRMISWPRSRCPTSRRPKRRRRPSRHLATAGVSAGTVRARLWRGLDSTRGLPA